LTLPAAEAMANVVYGLHETTFGGPSGFVGTLTLPGFISTDTTFPVSDFTVSNNGLGYTSIEFAPDSSSGNCSFFHGPPCDLINLENPNFTIFYGFTPGTFSKTSQNSVFGDDDSMELTISIPEPSTWALMLLGFGLLGGAGYWTRRWSVAVPA
jgi:hypothetical protein